MKGKAFKLVSRSGSFRLPGRVDHMREYFILSADTTEVCEAWVNVINENSYENIDVRVIQPSGEPDTVSPRDETESIPYFGVDLETIIAREGRPIPLLVERAIEYIEKIGWIQ